MMIITSYLPAFVFLRDPVVDRGPNSAGAGIGKVNRDFGVFPGPGLI